MLLGIEQRGHWTEDGNAKALELFQQAIARDPRDPVGYVQLARVYHQQMIEGWAESNKRAMADWLEAARTAVDLDPNYAFARLALGQRYTWAGDPRAAPELQRAAELAPGNSLVLTEVAAELPWLGQTARAEELIERSRKIDPAAGSLWVQRMVFFFARRFADTAAAAEAENHPDRDSDPWGTLSYAQLDRAADLARRRARLRDSWPDYSAEVLLGTADFGPQAIAERRLFLESHAKAELPNCATPEQLARHSEIRRLPECIQAQVRN
jgi:tetratricopeptide (TPR) repeat protein